MKSSLPGPLRVCAFRSTRPGSDQTDVPSGGSPATGEARHGPQAILPVVPLPCLAVSQSTATPTRAVEAPVC